MRYDFGCRSTYELCRWGREGSCLGVWLFIQRLKSALLEASVDVIWWGDLVFFWLPSVHSFKRLPALIFPLSLVNYFRSLVTTFLDDIAAFPRIGKALPIFFCRGNLFVPFFFVVNKPSFVRQLLPKLLALLRVFVLVTLLLMLVNCTLLVFSCDASLWLLFDRLDLLTLVSCPSPPCWFYSDFSADETIFSSLLSCPCVCAC